VIKRPHSKAVAPGALSLFLSLSVLLPLATNAQAQDATSAEQSAAPFQLNAAQAHLDTTPTPKVKPFTLNAIQVGAPDDPLKADTNFLLDPRGNPPLKAGVNTDHFALQASAAMRLLSKYNVELLVDRSQSMGQHDCPDGLSRWQWCGEQAASLAEAINPLVPQGLTIVPFATEYDVFENASARNIQYLFNNMQLQSGTRLFEPMAEQFDTYFANKSPNKKPLLVVVITDGVPVPKVEPVLVRNELVAASNRLKNPHDVTVVFCQIGCQDAKGQAYLEDLDQNLGQYGARYDIVHTIPFDSLQQYGLGPSLAAALQKFAPPPAPEVHALVAKASLHASSSLSSSKPSVSKGHSHQVKGGAG